jgi:hypothetical protein
MFAFGIACSLLLWQGGAIPFFVLAMALWGFYFDLSNFGMMDYVSRTSMKRDHSGSFGTIWAFRSTGYVPAPLIMTVVLSGINPSYPFLFMWLFMSIAFLFYIALYFVTKKEKKEYLHVVPEKYTRRMIKLTEF